MKLPATIQAMKCLPNRTRAASAWACLPLLLLGCAQSGDVPGRPAAGSEPPPSQGRPPMVALQLQPQVRLALEDAARRSGRDASKLQVVLATPVTWPDGSLGCPQPGRMYTQALVPGYRIVIAAGDETFEYHGSVQGAPSYCPPERLRPPVSDPRT